jgi:mRNA-degrading endonuclease RelE of RelBE toxin-antitoxin system
MNFEIITTPHFEKSLKKLAKHYKSLKLDFAEFIQSLQNNPFQGVELFPGIRKIRMSVSSKGKGKSGGARVITYTVCIDKENGSIYLVEIYDKSVSSTVDISILQDMLKELGL